MTTTRRYYANAAPQQTLQSQITSGATTLVINGTFAGWPTNFPFFACLEFGTASMEIVSVTGITGTTATIVRAQDSTSAISHNAGATFDQVVIRQDLDEANAHTSATSGVHGLAGNVVGDSDTQTLANKTLTSPTITGTVAGSASFTSPTLTSPTISGTVANSATNNLTGAGTALAVTNNVTVGGTIVVTGTATVKLVSATGGFSQLIGDGTTGVGLSVVPGKAGIALRTTNVANSSVPFSVDDTGLITHQGSNGGGNWTVPQIQHGNTTVTFTAASTASVTVTFPKAFSGTPEVTFDVSPYTNNTPFDWGITACSSTAVTLFVKQPAGTSITATPTVRWIAVF